MKTTVKGKLLTDRVPPPSYVRTPSAGFLGSLDIDRALVRFDLAGSLAHVEMLGAVGLVTSEEAAALRKGLRDVAREVESGRFPWRDELEDVHTNVEVRLQERIGSVAGKLHTARSRNDQIALDERLYLRSAVHEIARRLAAVEGTLLTRAEGLADLPMPGFTHLQRAQTVSAGHWLLAHFWRFDRDLDRLAATERRANVSPLGAGALAGSTLPIDPARVAARLGFDRAFENSLDAVSDRDPFVELLFDLALLAVHASALGEEVVLFASKEFGLVERTDALGSGSSLMPQKRNPDVAELVRGKSGRAVGDLVALLTVLKGLPLAYDRDLQEDKSIVFDAVRTLAQVLDALADLVGGLRVDATKARAAAADPELAATDLAEYLVRQNVPFREAHEQVASEYRTQPNGAEPRTLRAVFPTVGTEDDARLDPDAALARRISPGGPGPRPMVRQLELARARREAHAAFLSSLGQRAGIVEEILTEERT